MRDPEQKIRFNKSELALLKGLFANNEELLFAIRKVFLQDGLTESELALVKSLSEEAHKIIRKVINPDIDTDAPLGQISSLLLQLGSDIKTIHPDEAWPFIRAKDVEIAYINQQLEALKDPAYPQKIVLRDLMSTKGPKTAREDLYVDVLVFNWILSWVDSCMSALKTLAGQKEETPEEAALRLTKNSNK